jgi:hypothetical protein
MPLNGRRLGRHPSMHIRKKQLMLKLAVVSAPPLLLAGLFAYCAVAAAYPWRDRDWNQDGHTSLAEYLHATDVGRLPIVHNGENCWEHFEFKDGLPIKIVCPSQGATPR